MLIEFAFDAITFLYLSFYYKLTNYNSMKHRIDHKDTIQHRTKETLIGLL